jgi:hypothetical protein
MHVKFVFGAVTRTALLATLGAIFTLAVPPESRADFVSYNFTGFVENSQIAGFTTNEIITASFTLDTSLAVAQPQLNGPNQILYSGAVTSFQFGSISLTPPYSNNIVSVANNFYNNVVYVNQFYVEADLPDGSGALMLAALNSPTPNSSFISSLAIPTSLNFSLANAFTLVYYNSSNQQVDMGFTPAGGVSATPLPPAWTMMLIGLGGFGFVAYGRKSKSGLLAA